MQNAVSPAPLPSFPQASPDSPHLGDPAAGYNTVTASAILQGLALLGGTSPAEAQSDTVSIYTEGVPLPAGTGKGGGSGETSAGGRLRENEHPDSANQNAGDFQPIQDRQCSGRGGPNEPGVGGSQQLPCSPAVTQDRPGAGSPSGGRQSRSD